MWSLPGALETGSASGGSLRCGVPQTLSPGGAYTSSQQVPLSHGRGAGADEELGTSDSVGPNCTLRGEQLSIKSLFSHSPAKLPSEARKTQMHHFYSTGRPSKWGYSPPLKANITSFPSLPSLCGRQA